MHYKDLLNLDEKLTKEIQKHSVIKTYTPGDMIISQGAYKDQTAFIIDGLVKVFIEQENSSLLLYHLCPESNCIASFMNIFTHTPIEVSMQSIHETTLMWVSNSKIMELAEEFSCLKLALINSYQNNHYHLRNALKNLTVNTLEDRLYEYLKVKSKHYKTSDLKIPHSEIAMDLNFSREAISRAVKRLEIIKKVIRKPRSIVLVNA